MSAIASGTYLNARYLLETELGRGGMGVVYRARDTLLNRDVAVKILDESRLGVGARLRLFREAQAAARLNHPNIATVYDAGEAENTPFIVMELVEGPSLYEQRPEGVDEIMAIARQICAALEHAHAHGVIHRDLKPENVLLTAAGTAKLVDFGLARSVATRITREGLIVGTVYYLAPELALSKRIDGRVDLYALGVMLYEMTTGRLPFTADDPVSIISQHLHAPVVPPRALNEAIPPMLETLILRLMAKEPDERPASASETGQTLARIIATGGWERTQAPDTSSLLDRIVRGRFVGRSRAMAEARAVWTGVRNGQSRTLLISGEPGVGKSRLVRELATQVEVSGGRVLEGICYPEGGLPYEPFVQIIRRAMRQKVVEELKLPAYVVADLLVLAPTLGHHYPSIEPNPALDARQERFRLFESVVAFFRALADRWPLLLVVEDLHWGDEGSIALFHHLSRRLRERPVLTVATYREVEIDAGSALGELLIDLQRQRLAARLKLTPLDREATAALLETFFAGELPAGFIDNVFRETEGNPFFIEEVCKALVEEGHIAFQSGRWRVPDFAQLQVPQSIRATIQTRVSCISTEAQEILLLAAILGREFDFEVLSRASALDEERLIHLLEEAERAQLVAPLRDGAVERFIFAHTLIPATLRETVGSLRRRRLHRKAAQALEVVWPDDFEALAYQYAEAGDEKRARRYFVRAANRARQVYANEDAARFYTQALELTMEDGRDRFDLLAARAAIYDLLGRRAQQLADAQAMVELAERLGDEARKCDALLALADVYLATEHLRAREPAERAVKIARTMGDLVREGHALRRVGDQAHRRYDFAASRSALETAAARFRKTGLVGDASACLSILSVVLSNLGEKTAALQAAREALAFSRQAGDQLQEATSLRRLAINYLDQFAYPEALPYAYQALALHTELGDRYQACNDLNTIGVILAKTHDGVEAEKMFRRSLEIAEDMGSVTAILYAVNNLLLFHYRRMGAYAGGLAFVEQQLARARETRDQFFITNLEIRKARLLALLGCYEAARDLGQEVFPTAGLLMGGRAQVGLLSLLGRVCAELGEFDQADSYLETAHSCVKSLGLGIEAALPLIEGARAALRKGAPEDLLRGLQRAEQAVDLLTGASGSWVDVLGEALCTSAHLHLALSAGDDVPAHKALSRTRRVLELAEGSPEVAPPEEMYFVHARALEATGEVEEAQDHLRRAYERVMLVAGQIQDASMHTSWLEHVPENRTIVAAWKARTRAG